MYDLGDTVPFGVEITDGDGLPTTPATITLTIYRPDGTADTPSPTAAAVGRYVWDYVPTMAGPHGVRWATTAPATAHVETFDVRPIDSGYILSLTTAKAALNIPATSTGDDEELRALIEAVGLVVEDYRKEAVIRRTVTERISTSPTRSLLLGKVPVIAVTSISRVADGYAWPSGDLTLNGDLGEVVSSGLPFSGDLTAVTVVGRAIMPANYVEAAKIITKHLWQTQQTPGMGSRVMGVGGDDISAGIAGLGFALPNRAAELLGGRGVICA